MIVFYQGFKINAIETVSSIMEKRENFVQAVSKELVGEFLQFVQLDVSFRF